MESYQQFCFPGTECRELMLQTAEAVKLRVIHFKPPGPSPYPPVVMVVGLATVIESFQGVIREMSRDFEVYYVETREKSSSQLKGRVNFDMATMARDIIAIIKLLRLPSNQYILYGYSFSASVIIEAYHGLESKPASLILLSPTPDFYYPKWSLPLIRIAVPFYSILKPVAKWYLRNFVINRQDGEMYQFTSVALDRADPEKLKNAILAIAGYKVWDKLELIDCSTLIVDTSKDGLHVHKDILRLRDSIRGCNYIDLEYNKRTHGPELVVVIRKYLSDKPFL